MQAEYDEGGSIGKRYRRQDEIGTPWCVTIDHQSLEDRTVTVRDRDSLEQERVAIDDLPAHLTGSLHAALEVAEAPVTERSTGVRNARVRECQSVRAAVIRLSCVARVRALQPCRSSVRERRPEPLRDAGGRQADRIGGPDRDRRTRRRRQRSSAAAATTSTERGDDRIIETGSAATRARRRRVTT